MADLTQQGADKENAELGMVRPGSPLVGNNRVEVAMAEPNANVPATTETEGANPPVDVKLEPTVPPEGVEVGSREEEVGSKELGVRSKEEGVGGQELVERSMENAAASGEGQVADGVTPTDSEVVPMGSMKDMVAKISSTEGASAAGAMGVEDEIRAQREAGGQVSANE